MRLVFLLLIILGSASSQIQAGSKGKKTPLNLKEFIKKNRHFEKIYFNDSNSQYGYIHASYKQGIISIQVLFTVKKPQYFHRPWQWDSKSNKFKASEVHEDSLSLVFLPNSDHEKVADLWYWGAERSESGFAEDQWINLDIEKDAPLKVNKDHGDRSWQLRLRPLFFHSNPKRYTKQAPSGSRADIKVTSKYNGHFWAVTFTRPINTSNPDDLALRESLLLSVSLFKNSKAITKDNIGNCLNILIHDEK